MEPATRSIGARSYTVAPLPAFKALDVFEMLSVVIGPAITALAAAGQSGEVQPVAEALFKQLGGGKLRNLANQLLEGVLVEEAGKTAMMTVGFDIRYAGQLFGIQGDGLRSGGQLSRFFRWRSRSNREVLSREGRGAVVRLPDHLKHRWFALQLWESGDVKWEEFNRLSLSDIVDMLDVRVAANAARARRAEEEARK